MPPKKSNVQQMRGAISGFLDRTPLIALSVCHIEKGTTIDVPGHWWEGTTASEQTLIFKCSVIKWDPDFKWNANSRDQVPKGAFTLRVEGRDEEPYQMSRLDYSRFSQKQRPISAAVPTLALEAGPSGASASEEQTASREDSATPETGHSKIWDFVAKLSKSELDDRQRHSTEEKKTHKCLICSIRLTQHRNSTSGLLNHIKNKHHIEYAEIIKVSRHAKTRMSDVGTVISVYNFQESTLHHIRFVIWCVVKKRPFFIALDAEFRSFVGGLDTRYVPPHRETCWKIVNVIVELLKVRSTFRFLLTFF